jgi:hypothetical protein
MRLLAITPQPALPLAGIPTRVQTGDDAHRLIVDNEEHSEGETPEKRTASVLADLWETKGLARHLSQASIDDSSEVPT